MFYKLFDWLSLRDVDEDIRSTGREVAARFGRRSIRQQSGDVMWADEFQQHVLEGDRAAALLRAHMARFSPAPSDN